MGVGASWLRERSEWDAGEPVDIVFNVPFRPLVISLLHICQEVIKPVKIDGFPRADESAFYNSLP